MKTITKQVNLYRFAELSDNAKGNAISRYFSDYDWSGEAMDSLKAFAEHFGSKLTDWQVDFGCAAHSSAEFADVDLEPEELEAMVKQLKHDGSCQFTGVCFDDDCNQGAVESYNDGERDAMEVLRAGFESWLSAVQSDYEHQTGEDAVSESCEANDYWFTEDGHMA